MIESRDSTSSSCKLVLALTSFVAAQFKTTCSSVSSSCSTSIAYHQWPQSNDWWYCGLCHQNQIHHHQIPSLDFRIRMSSAASFSERWAQDNLSREATPYELIILGLFSTTCSGDEEEAAGRARRYYSARGPGGVTELWHKRRPDDEDILSSCQDVYVSLL